MQLLRAEQGRAEQGRETKIAKIKTLFLVVAKRCGSSW